MEDQQDAEHGTTAYPSLQSCDAFEAFMWSSYSRYASQCDGNQAIPDSCYHSGHTRMAPSDYANSSPLALVSEADSAMSYYAASIEPADYQYSPPVPGLLHCSSSSSGGHSSANREPGPSRYPLAFLKEEANETENEQGDDDEDEDEDDEATTFPPPPLEPQPQQPRQLLLQQQQHHPEQRPQQASTHKRERNRLSARHCRQRSKLKLSQLERAAAAAQQHRDSLLREIKTLQYELIAAQVECMAHVRCRCPEVKVAMARPAAAAVEGAGRVAG